MRETSIEVSGRTEEDAIQNALRKIGLDRDEVSVEIVRRAKSGLLGIGGTTAVVKVTYMTDEPEPVAAATVVEAPVKAAEPSVKAGETFVKAYSAPAAPAKPLEGSTAERASQFLAGLLERMGTVATPVLREEGETIYIDLQGPDMGSIIGRRGETLDAIQHLANYAVNRGTDERTRIYVDAEHYRKKREETLVRLANKVAEKVVRYRKNMGLEPMNAYERHVIHTALQDTPNVTTYSAGTEPHRRVFVAYDRAKKGVAPAAATSVPTVSANVASSSDSAPKFREWS